MDKSKLAEWGDKLKTSGAQMSRMVSGKVKEMLQAPTLESKMVDDVTLESMEEPNWGMNMRICAMINSEEFNGTEVVKAIKKKISGKSVVSQRLSLELLEACAMNCEKVFSEVASEKVLDEMVKLVKNGEADTGNRNRAFQLIRAWGQSEDLAYLPVFQQTYMSLEDENALNPRDHGSSLQGQNSLEALLQRPIPVPPPGSYPIPSHLPPRGDDGNDDDDDDDVLASNFGNLTTKDKKEQVEITRNSLELLSSMLNTEGQPNNEKDDLMVSLVEKCKQSQPVIQMIIESTTDDEGLLFEALHLNDELQRVLSTLQEPKPDHQKPIEEPSSGNLPTIPKSILKKSNETKARESSSGSIKTEDKEDSPKNIELDEK